MSKPKKQLTYENVCECLKNIPNSSKQRQTSEPKNMLCDFPSTHKTKNKKWFGSNHPKGTMWNYGGDGLMTLGNPNNYPVEIELKNGRKLIVN